MTEKPQDKRCGIQFIKNPSEKRRRLLGRRKNSFWNFEERSAKCATSQCEIAPRSLAEAADTMGESEREPVVVRTSRKGYHKGDVNGYIEEMNIRFSAREEELTGRIRELEKAFAEGAASGNPSSGASGNAAGEVPAGKNPANGNATGEAPSGESFTGEKATSEAPAGGSSSVAPEAPSSDLREELARLERENRALREELAALSARVAAEEKEAKKAPDSTDPVYREMSEKLGGILLRANLEAERMVSEAKAEAEKQRSEAKKSAEGIRLEAAVSARLAAAAVKTRLAELTGDWTKGLEALSEEATADYLRLCEDMKKRAAEALPDLSKIDWTKA